MSSPLFSDDLIGFVKFLAIMLFTVLLPVAGLVVYFLKRTDVAKEAATQKDIDGLGSRVSAVERDVTQISQEVAAYHRAVDNAARDSMEAFRASAEMQLRAVHAVEVQVARLDERNDLGECINNFGEGIKELVNAIREDRGGSKS